jgi:hypothetical protein
MVRTWPGGRANDCFGSKGDFAARPGYFRFSSSTDIAREAQQVRFGPISDIPGLLAKVHLVPPPEPSYNLPWCWIAAMVQED